MNRFNLTEEETKSLMTKQKRKSGKYKCLDCGTYFNSHENMAQHLFEDLVQTDSRYNEDFDEVEE